MNIESKTIITKITGDPFVDAGGFVIKYLSEIFPDKNTYQLIEYATNIYVKQWHGKLHTFFLNSSITQPAFDSEKKIVETLKYYKGLLEETNIEYIYGICRITGQETKLYEVGRHNHLMSASGTFINFHSGYQGGLYLSKEAIISVFFLPLGVCFVGDKIALLQSNYEDVAYFLIKKNIEENLKNISSGIGEGTLKSEFGIVANALFSYADFCIGNLKIATIDEEETIALKDVQLNMYHFTNFGAGPDIVLHSFSNRLFAFYAYCKKNHRSEWNGFINQHYKYSKFKDAQFDIPKQEWHNKTERLSLDSYKIWNNSILNKLIRNESIISLLSKWSRKNKFSFNIVEIYCINILKMDKYTIQKIKELSDFIIDNKSDDEIKKAIVRLNGFKNTSDFRLYIIKLIKENYESKNTTVLITLEDYVLYLFPDGTYWKEIRDLLLIAIYQKLHELNLMLEGIPEIEETEE